MSHTEQPRPLAFINTTKRILALNLRGLAITDRAGEVVALVLPDADGYFHHHAEAVRQQVDAALAGGVTC